MSDSVISDDATLRQGWHLDSGSCLNFSALFFSAHISTCIVLTFRFVLAFLSAGGGCHSCCLRDFVSQKACNVGYDHDGLRNLMIYGTSAYDEPLVGQTWWTDQY